MEPRKEFPPAWRGAINIKGPCLYFVVPSQPRHPWPRTALPRSPVSLTSPACQRLMIGQTRAHQMWHTVNSLWWDDGDRGPVWSVRWRCWWPRGEASSARERPGPGRGWTRRLAELSPSPSQGITSQITRGRAPSASTMSVSCRGIRLVKYSMFNFILVEGFSRPVSPTTHLHQASFWILNQLILHLKN